MFSLGSAVKSCVLPIRASAVWAVRAFATSPSADPPAVPRAVTGDRSTSLLTVGGSGYLGRAVTKRFKDAKWTVTNLDYRENNQADQNVLLNADFSFKDRALFVQKKLGKKKVGLIVCTAGAWSGDALSQDSFLSSAETLIDSNLRSALLASFLAPRYLNNGGLLVLVGAAASLAPTPEMISYGFTKAAVHHLLGSMASGALPRHFGCAGLLLNTLDTPVNRRARPQEDFSSWTPPEVVANRLLEWADARMTPVNGGMYIVETRKGDTEFRLMD